MGKCWFKLDRVVVNPVNLWFPVDAEGSAAEWDFDVVSVSLHVIKCMGGCDFCGCSRSRVIYVLASEEALLCQRCFFRWVDDLEEMLAVQ